MLGTDEYKAQKWQESLKRTFLATDEDMRSSKSPSFRFGAESFSIAKS